MAAMPMAGSPAGRLLGIEHLRPGLGSWQAYRDAGVWASSQAVGQTAGGSAIRNLDLPLYETFFQGYKELVGTKKNKCAVPKIVKCSVLLILKKIGF